jgi:hypothetical protein
MHFSVRDLRAVRNVAVPDAFAQVAVAVAPNMSKMALQHGRTEYTFPLRTLSRKKRHGESARQRSAVPSSAMVHTDRLGDAPKMSWVSFSVSALDIYYLPRDGL